MAMVSPELKKDPWFIRLLYIRQMITNVEKKVKAEGATALTTTDYTNLRRLLEMAAYHKFDEEGIHYKESKVGIAVSHLRKEELYDGVAEIATTLYDRWERGDFSPGPVLSKADEEFSSDEESEEEVVDGAVGRSDLMKGILITRGAAGGRTYMLDPDYPRRDAAVVGANGLKVGDWWPFQICALRDGAHGSRMGGIHGRADGAYSVVISGSYEDADSDFGDTIYYSGSRGAAEPGRRGQEAVMTNASKSLMMSSQRRKPVRVFRASKCSSTFAPRVGMRYDGLYDVLSYSQQTTTEGLRYWRFTLRRQGDQAPIDQNRPNTAERREYARMMSKY